MRHELNPVRHALREGVPLLSGNDAQRQFVLAYGKAFEPAALPKGMRHRRVGSCFESSAKFVIDPQNRDAGMTYVEGFAIGPGSPLPVHHAWLARDGAVIDLTWRWAHEAAYFGIEFPPALVAQAMFARGYYGMLDPVDDLITSSIA